MYKISDLYFLWFLRTEKREQEELEKCIFCHISHVSSPVLTIFYMHIHIEHSYHPVVAKVDYN